MIAAILSPKTVHSIARYDVLGFLPLRATCRPLRPIWRASSAVTSSSIDPLRASAKVILTLAPLPSSISLPDRSLTRNCLTRHGSSLAFLGLRKTKRNYSVT